MGTARGDSCRLHALADRGTCSVGRIWRRGLVALGSAACLLLGVVAFSHWVLDLIVHRGDMPILPGNAGDLPLLGFGLWRVPIVSIPLEAALFLGGVFLYWRAAKKVGSRPGSRVTPTLVAGVLLASGAIVLALDALSL